jgi:hypothetical protein
MPNEERRPLPDGVFRPWKKHRNRLKLVTVDGHVVGNAVVNVARADRNYYYQWKNDPDFDGKIEIEAELFVRRRV